MGRLLRFDGRRAGNSCCVAMGAANGSSVTTMEGFRETEYAVLDRAFAAVSAVQCGFCIPGIIISAKSLLDENLNPTRADVKLAIQGNLCRCTGYKKMEDATLLAADFFRQKREIPPAPSMLHMDEHAKRIDAAEKINGTGLFADDLATPGILYAKPVYSKYPRALINRIDVSRSLAHPDCVEVLLKQDVPCNKIGHIKQDWDVILGEGDITRYVGNVLAVVATGKQELLKELCALVEADYTELTPVTSPFEALRGDAPMIHEDGNVMSRANLVRGNADEAIESSKYVVTRKYKTSWQEHGFMDCVAPCPRARTACCSIPPASPSMTCSRSAPRCLGFPGNKCTVTRRWWAAALAARRIYVGAAVRGADGVGHQKAREGEVDSSGVFELPCQAPPHGNGVHHRLR